MTLIVSTPTGFSFESTDRNSSVDRLESVAPDEAARLLVALE